MGRIDPAAKAAYDRERRAAKHDELIETERARRVALTSEQKERRLAWTREWRAAHPDKVREYNARNHTSGYTRRWREAAKARDPEAWRRAQRAIRIKSKYGLTIDQYEAMLDAQGDVCAICKRPETTTIKGTTCMLAVDHDPESSVVRGLLCVNCNMLIGGAHHDPDILRAAIAYLDRHAAQPDRL